MMGVRQAGRIGWNTIQSFMQDECPRMAAALSYYTVFSLAPLLVLVVLITGVVVEAGTVEQLLQGELGGLLGPEGAEQVQTMIRNVERPGAGGPLATVLGTAALVLGATAAFAQIQSALNTAWKVEPDPTRGDIRNFLLKRVLSFAMILGVGFLLLVLLVVSALLAAFTDLVGRTLLEGVSGPLLFLVDAGFTLGIITLLFAAMFKLLPDAVVAWRDALVGGVASALLFTLGKFLIGFYLGRSDPGGVFGAAGSLAVILLWVYYTSMILLLGAEFTWVWARNRGDPIRPEPGAVRVTRVKHREAEGAVRTRRRPIRLTGRRKYREDHAAPEHS